MCKDITTRQALRAIVTMHDLNRMIHTPYWYDEAEATAKVVARIVHRPLEWLGGEVAKVSEESEPVTLAHPLPMEAQQQIFRQLERVRMAISMRSTFKKEMDGLIACIRYYTMEEGDQL